MGSEAHIPQNTYCPKLLYCGHSSETIDSVLLKQTRGIAKAICLALISQRFRDRQGPFEKKNSVKMGMAALHTAIYFTRFLNPYIYRKCLDRYGHPETVKMPWADKV